MIMCFVISRRYLESYRSWGLSEYALDVGLPGNWNCFLLAMPVGPEVGKTQKSGCDTQHNTAFSMYQLKSPDMIWFYWYCVLEFVPMGEIANTFPPEFS